MRIKPLGALLALALTGSVVAPAGAAAAAAVSVPPPLTVHVPLPGSPWYSWMHWWEALELKLAPSPTVAANLLAQFADGEAAVAAQSAAHGRWTAARQALSLYSRDVVRAGALARTNPAAVAPALSLAITDGALLAASVQNAPQLARAADQALARAIRAADDAVAVTQMEGIVALPTPVTSAPAPPPPGIENGLGNGTGSAGAPASSGVALTLVGHANAIAVGNPVWVLMGDRTYTGALEPGQRVHLLLIDNVAVIIRVQTRVTPAVFVSYTPSSGTTAAQLTLTEPFMAQGTSFTVTLAPGATLRMARAANDWSKLTAGQRLLVTYDNSGAIVRVVALGRGPEHPRHKPGHPGRGSHGPGDRGGRHDHPGPGPHHGAAIRGWITAVTASTITVDGTTYTLASTVRVEARGDASLSVADLAPGMLVALELQNNQVTTIELLPMPPVRGTVSSLGAGTITVGSETYTLAANVVVRGAGITQLAQLTAGAHVLLRFNSRDEVDVIQVMGAPHGHHGR
jgi:hypothetical protein